jgi:hypothetical protein
MSDRKTLSNSSIQQIPLSASISAPASMQNSPVSLTDIHLKVSVEAHLSLMTLAVRPAADEALPTDDFIKFFISFTRSVY